MVINNKLYFDCLQLCSGHYLCANLPNNWESLEWEEQVEFLEENKWSAVEHLSAEDLDEAIESAALATYYFIEDFIDISIDGTN